MFRRALRSPNIARSNWPRLGLKRPFWSAAGKPIFVIAPCRMKKSARRFRNKGNNHVWATISHAPADAKHRRLDGLVADDRVVSVVAVDVETKGAPTGGNKSGSTALRRRGS